MQKNELWELITRKNPQFLAGCVTLTANGLRKLFDTAWDQGHKQGMENGRVIGAEAAKKANPIADMFEKMGTRKRRC